MKKIITIIAIAFSMMAMSQKAKAQCLSPNTSPIVGAFAATTTVGGNTYSGNGPDLNSVQGNYFEVTMYAGYQYRFWLSYWYNTYETGISNLYATVTDSANNILVPFTQGPYIQFSTNVTKTVRVHVTNVSCTQTTFSTVYSFYLYVYTDAKCGTTWRDADGDGYGNAADSLQYNACAPTTGYVTNKTDCDDNNPNAHMLQTWYKDVDQDGFGDMADPGVLNCGTPATNTVVPHYVTNHTDCDDSSPLKHIVQTWFVDADGDGSGSASDLGTSSCGNPAFRSSSSTAYSLDNKDCDDTNPFIGPGAVEIYGNSIDENCDGLLTPVNNALNFNGTSYIQVPHSASLNLDSTFTIEALVYNINDGNANHTIIDKGSYDYLLQIQSNKLAYYTAASGWHYSTQLITDNQWTHVAVTHEADDTIRLYINGIADGVFGNVAPAQDNGFMNIGRQEPANCGCNLYNGNIDEVRVWNVARTPAQLNRFKNSALCYMETGLAAYYKFDQGSPSGNNTALTSLIDQSGNGNNGMFISFGLNGATTNFILGDSIPFTQPAAQAWRNAPYVCLGDTLSLFGTGANTYIWNNQVQNRVAFAPTVTKTYVMLGIDSVGCSNLDSVMLPIVMLPAVMASVTSLSVCTGSVDTLKASGANTYVWSNNAASASTASVVITPSASNTYTVIGTDNSSGCSNTATVSVVVSTCGMGIDGISLQNNVVVYPNPNNGSFVVTTNQHPKTIVVTDVLGNELLSITPTDNNTAINLNTQANGIYFVKIITDNAQTVKRVVINN